MRQKGFTIIEVLVVLTIFGLFLTVITTLFTSVQYAQRDAFYISVATNAARSELERLRSSDFDSITDGPFLTPLPDTLPPGSSGVIDVSTPTNAPDSKLIDVTVTYQAGGATKTVTISGYIDPEQEVFI